jgi:DNA polymerase IV
MGEGVPTPSNQDSPEKKATPKNRRGLCHSAFPKAELIFSYFVRFLYYTIFAMEGTKKSIILRNEGLQNEVPENEPVNWLFLDLNSYFASVEQETRPELRGRPVGVVPVVTDSTVCIAASYEAKACGVRTGTGVKDAKQICPSIQLVEARHELYVQYHHRIVEMVETCIPVAIVASIDEMACQLMGRERPISNAMQLAAKIKQTIRERVGSTLRCSIGLAPNRFLAKVASDVQKPDGLTVIRLSQLPANLYGLKPTALPGIGRRMNQRLERQGIFTMEQLCALSSEQMRSLWGSVVGEQFWYWLRGVDLEEGVIGSQKNGSQKNDPEKSDLEKSELRKSELQKSVGHQHVLPPELRTMQGANGVAQKLLHKAAMRIRRLRMWARGISVHVRFAPWREGKYWEAHTRIAECQDTISLQETFHKLWKGCPAGKPVMVGVSLYDLVPDNLHTAALFPEEQKRSQLSRAIDSINAKYGSNAVYLGGVHHVREAAPTRIAFSSIPEFD